MAIKPPSSASNAYEGQLDRRFLAHAGQISARNKSPPPRQVDKCLINAKRYIGNAAATTKTGNRRQQCPDLFTSAKEPDGPPATWCATSWRARLTVAAITPSISTSTVGVKTSGSHRGELRIPAHPGRTTGILQLPSQLIISLGRRSFSSRARVWGED